MDCYLAGPAPTRRGWPPTRHGRRGSAPLLRAGFPNRREPPMSGSDRHLPGGSVRHPELIRSLCPGEPGALKVKPDGTIMDGHHRVYVLRERGLDIDALPRKSASTAARGSEDLLWPSRPCSSPPASSRRKRSAASQGHAGERCRTRRSSAGGSLSSQRPPPSLRANRSPDSKLLEPRQAS